MYDYQTLLGGAVALLSLVGYAFYFRSIFRGKTKAHPFTWFVFTVIDGIVFTAQYLNGGGPGSWVIGVSSVMNLVVFIFALTRGEKTIARIDWICFICALAGIVFWLVTSSPLTAVLFAALADALAKVPTIRKSYTRPHEESVSIWSFDVFKFSLSVAALSSLTLTTAFFPIEAAATNMVVIFVVLVRRRQLRIRA